MQEKIHTEAGREVDVEAGEGDEVRVTVGNDGQGRVMPDLMLTPDEAERVAATLQRGARASRGG